MAQLNFPDPNDTQEFEAAGILWTWNSTLGVWSSETTTAFDAGELYLSKRNDDAADGNIDFRGLTTHQQGVQLPNLTNAGALATDVDGNIIAGLGGDGEEPLWVEDSGNLSPKTLSNKVGIGTDDPQSNLHVKGSNATITLQVAAANESGKVFFKKPDGSLIGSVSGYEKDNALLFRGTSAEFMRINTIGDVGIGTTRPSTKLDVNGDITIQGVKNASSLATDAAGKIVAGPEPAESLWEENSGKLYPKTLTNNVGIGTNNPARTFHIRNDTGFNQLNQSTGTFSYLCFQDSGSTNNNSVRVGSNGNDAVIYAAGGEKVRIKSNARVGIGTNDPQRTLHVRGSNATLGLQVTAAGHSARLYFEKNDGTLIGSIQGLESDGAMTFRGTSAERMRIAANGNVGINQNNPTFKLDVTGTARFTGKTTHENGISSTSASANFFAGETTVATTTSATAKFRMHLDGRVLTQITGSSSAAPPITVIRANNSAAGSWSGISLRSANSDGSNQNTRSIIQLNGTSTRMIDVRMGATGVAMADGATDIVKALQPKVITQDGETFSGFLPADLAGTFDEAVEGEAGATVAVGTYTDADGVIQTDVVEPEAIPFGATWQQTGTQDVMQGVSRGELIPLLTKALQEALERIEVLEQEHAAMQGTSTTDSGPSSAY